MKEKFFSTIVIKTIFPLFIFLTVFISHYKSPILTSFDSRYSIHIAESLIRNHDIDLDEYEFSKNSSDYALFRNGGHAYGVYPIVTSIMAVPFAAVFDKIVIDRKFYYSICEKATASCIVALTSLIIYYMALLVSGQIFVSGILFICFAYSTTAWSIASRGLWSHGPSMLLISLILLTMLYAEIKNKLWLIPFVGILAAFAYIARPTNAVVVIFLSIYIFIKYRKQFTMFIGCGLCVAILFACFNKLFYGLVFHPYYTFPLGINRELLSPWLLKVTVPNPEMMEAFFGNLISPNRGLFVFSPIFVFCLSGVFLKIKNKSFHHFDLMLVGLLLAHLVLISKTLKYWWGGYSFGPRYFTDILPVLIYFLIPAITEPCGNYMSVIRNKIYFAGFSLCLFFGIFVHYQGASSEAVWKWNSREELTDWVHGNSDHIDWHPERVWDYHDIQFFSGLFR